MAGSCQDAATLVAYLVPYLSAFKLSRGHLFNDRAARILSHTPGLSQWITLAATKTWSFLMGPVHASEGHVVPVRDAKKDVTSVSP